MKRRPYEILVALIIFWFATLASSAQPVQVLFPTQNAVDISINPTFQIKANYPYKFHSKKLDSTIKGKSEIIVKHKVNDSDYVVKGRMQLFLYDAARTKYSISNNSAHGNEYNDTVLNLTVMGNLMYTTKYDIVLDSIELENSLTGAIVKYCEVKPQAFTTIKAPFAIISTNAASGKIAANESIFFRFNDDLPTNNIKNEDFIQIMEYKSDQDYWPIDYSFIIGSDNKSVYIQPFSMSSEHIYKVFYNASRLTGNPEDDEVFTFVKNDVTALSLNSQLYIADEDRYVNITNPGMDYTGGSDSTSILLLPGLKSVLSTPSVINNNYGKQIFVRWDCPTIPELHNNKNTVIEYVGSDIYAGAHGVKAIYKTIPTYILDVPYDMNYFNLNVIGYQKQLSKTSFLISADANVTVELTPLKVTGSVPNFKDWVTDIPNYGNNVNPPSNAKRCTFNMIQLTGNDLLQDILWKNNRFKLTHGPIYIDPPVYCPEAWIHFEVMADKETRNDLIPNNPNRNYRIKTSYPRRPGWVDVNFAYVSNYYSEGNSITVPINDRVLDVNIELFDRDHYIRDIEYGGRNIYHADQDDASPVIDFRNLFVLITNYACYDDMVIHVARKTYDITYSWIARDEDDIETAFSENDLSISPAFSNGRALNSNECVGTYARTVKYLQTSSLLLKSITCTVLAGSQVTLTPQILLDPNNGVIEKIRWTPPSIDYSFIAAVPPDFVGTLIADGSKNVRFEFRINGFRLIDLAIEDTASTPNSIVYKSVPIKTTVASGSPINQSTFLAGMNASGGKEIYSNLPQAVQYSIWRDSVESTNMRTTSVRLTFNRKVDRNSLKTGLTMGDVERRDCDNRPGKKTVYTVGEENIMDCYDQTAVIKIIDDQTGLEVSHLGRYKIGVTAGVLDRNGRSLINSQEHSFRTEGPLLYIEITNVHCYESESNCYFWKRNPDHFYFFTTVTTYSQPQGNQPYPTNLDIDHYAYKYPGNNQSDYYDIDDDEDRSVQQSYLPWVKIKNTEYVYNLGFQGMDGDAKDALHHVTTIISDLLSTMGKFVPANYRIYIDPLQSLIGLIQKWDSGDDDDNLGCANMVYSNVNSWGSNKSRFYKYIYQNREISGDDAHYRFDYKIQLTPKY